MVGDRGDHQLSGLEVKPYYAAGGDSVEEVAELADEIEIVQEEPEERQQWGNTVEFILTCIGYSVGLGNVWRFPYVCYENGGGAFLIPFTIFLFIAGVPLFYLELCFGQYASTGPMTIWKCAPLFKGIGICMLFISFSVCTYYNVIIAWVLFYLYNCFQAVLPWSTCGNDWNSKWCYNSYKQEPLTGSMLKLYELSCTNNVTFNFEAIKSNISNQSAEYFQLAIRCNQDVQKHLKSPSVEFYNDYVLEKSSGIEEIGRLNIAMVICLMIAWILVFLPLIKGVSSLGKVAYVTSVFPYIFLTILLVRGLTLPGSFDGIWFYVTPQFEKLWKPSVWSAAAGQVFFSFGIGWGGLIAFASYNSFHNNCLRDALIVCLADCFTSIYAGFVIFSIVGYMAFKQGKDVEKVIPQGPGLAFMAYPEVVATLDFPQVWAVFFFVMLLVLGLDTQFATVEGVVTSLCDAFPNVLRRHKQLTTLGMCVIWFFLGLTMCTQGGVFVFKLFDTYAASFNLLFSAIIEVLVVIWVYGFERFNGDIKCMKRSNVGVNMFFQIMWRFVTPISLICVFVLSILDYKRASLDDYTFPLWGDVIGWLFVVNSFVVIPISMIYQLVTDETLSHLDISDRIKHLLKPAKDWGPAKDENRSEDAKKRPNIYNEYNYNYVLPEKAGLNGVSVGNSTEPGTSNITVV